MSHVLKAQVQNLRYVVLEVDTEIFVTLNNRIKLDVNLTRLSFVECCLHVGETRLTIAKPTVDAPPPDALNSSVTNDVWRIFGDH